MESVWSHVIIYRYSNFCKEFNQQTEENVAAHSTLNQLKNINKPLIVNKKEKSKTMLSDFYNKCTFLAVDKGRYLTTNIKYLSKEKLHNLDMRFTSSDVSLRNGFRGRNSAENLSEHRKFSAENLITNNEKLTGK